jgi:Fic family protein
LAGKRLNQSTYLEKQKTKKLAQFEALKTNQNLKERQAALIASWQRKPKDFVSIENHQRYHGVTYQTARTDLLKLVEMGLARMIMAGKKQLYERI